MAGGNNDRVQLKQEEVVGNDVVLNDINPKTNTRSVDDPTTGLSLDKTIERMWQSINNKLSRIVNSVNGRTGVVVLTADDVGLGNVDNVSLADIKQWVINRMIVEFGHKRLILFDSLSDAITYISDNDETHRDKPFYSHHGFDGDKRAYIGYTWWDEGSQTLNETHMVIDTVGWTDNSIIYNEKLSDDKNFSGGGLGVNIYMYEDALELYNGLTKADSGLRIKKDKIVPHLYGFDGAYGDGTAEDESAFLYFNTPPTTDTPEISIYIDDEYITKAFIRMNDGTSSNDYKFKVGDLIICGFKDYRVWTPDDPTEDDPVPLSGKYVVPTGMHFGLMYRGACVGCITSAPTEFSVDDPYVVKFYTIEGNEGYSIEKIRNDTYETSGINPRDHYEVKLAIARYPMDNADRSSMSPIDAVMDESIPNYDTDDHKEKGLLRVNFPYGTDEIVFDKKTDTNTQGGLILNTDMSLCLQPYYACTSDWTPDRRGSATASNWTGVFGKGPATDVAMEMGNVVNDNTLIEKKIRGSGVADYASYLGVNLLKAAELHNPDEKPSTTENRFIFTNLSGLRINNSGYKVKPEFLGMTDGESSGETKGPEFGDEGITTSGGLSVNVGNFLEIKPGDVPETALEYYDSGKVNVRIGNGLGDDGNNRIAVIQDTEIFKTIEENGGKSVDALSITENGLSVPMSTLYGLFPAGGGIGIKIRNYDVPGTTLDDDVLAFSKKTGYLVAPINTKQGLVQTWNQTDERTTSGDYAEEGGLSVKISGNAVAFDSSGNVHVDVAFYKADTKYYPGTILFIPVSDATIIAVANKEFTASYHTADLIENCTRICQIPGMATE